MAQTVPYSTIVMVLFSFTYSTVEYVDPRVLFSTLCATTKHDLSWWHQKCGKQIWIQKLITHLEVITTTKGIQLWQQESRQLSTLRTYKLTSNCKSLFCWYIRYRTNLKWFPESLSSLEKSWNLLEFKEKFKYTMFFCTARKYAPHHQF